MDRTLTLSFSCPDASGIVAAVSSFIAGHRGWITEASQHTEHELSRFFMRVEIRADSLDFPADEFTGRFREIAERFGMEWRLSDSSRPKRVVILCSKQEHCLYDLLSRQVAQDFRFTVPCVISNHETHRKVVEAHGIPFHHVPVDPADKGRAYRRIEALCHEAKADLVVLARYMQVLSDDMCRALEGRVINIHHSFLPGFKGAKPYHQAHARGVKIVGATAHFVTADLDEGPIIEQDVTRVTHAHTAEQIVALGQDTERLVLARAVRHWAEDRVLLIGDRTVVFD